jgi:3,4-dihydroxy 2-butanone 4-phosphate synthase / GTP cyclohydrolase II
MPTSRLADTTELIAEIRAGRMVVLVDDEDRENEGDLVMAASCVSADAINFMAKHARGLICLTLTEERCRQLNLQLMVSDNRSSHGTAFTVSIEAASGVTTGISAADRATTIAAAVAPHATPQDLVQPGHIFPLKAQPGGVLARAGHTEAGCDLAQLAGFEPAAVICEILKDDGSMARLPDLVAFAQAHGLKIGSIANLIKHRSANESLVTRLSAREITTSAGSFQLVVYEDRAAHQPHLALIKGRPDPGRECLVRVHEPFTVIDAIDMESRAHSWSLGGALRAVAEHGEGVVVLLNCAPSAGVLISKLAPAVSGSGALAAMSGDGAASSQLRHYGIGAAILRDAGVGKMLLLSPPRKMPSMMGFGLEVTGYRGGETNE